MPKLAFIGIDVGGTKTRFDLLDDRFHVVQSIKIKTEKEPEGLGLPGDGLDLYAVLDLFQKSKTIEAFEKGINDPDKKAQFNKVFTAARCPK